MSAVAYERRREMNPIIDRAIRAANCADRELLRSYLVHCETEAQVATSIQQLRENCPAMFKKR
jgi:hypothetical protein